MMDLPRTLLTVSLACLLLLPGCVVVRDRGPDRSRHKRSGPRTKARPPCHPGQGPSDHAPAHGYRAQCPYRYYPGPQVYYSTKADVWFWIEGDEWTFGTRLPNPYHLEDENFVRVELSTPYPYQKHERIKKKHGPHPDRGKKNRGRKNKKNRGRGKGPPPHAGP